MNITSAFSKCTVRSNALVEYATLLYYVVTFCIRDECYTFRNNLEVIAECALYTVVQSTKKKAAPVNNFRN